ncbi:MAG: hypothetical protein K6U11_13655 [bacterium]|nr:hypothetical protein [bacterium]
MTKGKRSIVLLFFTAVISLSIIWVLSSYAQYTAGTLPPLNTAVGYGGFFNPYVFSPGLYRVAAGSYPLFDPFASLLSTTFNPLLTPSYYPIIPTFPFAPLPTPVTLPTTTALTTPTRTAAQSGTWVGTWTSTYIAYIVLWHTGPMTLNIVVDPLLGTVLGTAVFAGSKYASIPFSVDGVKVNNVISLSGLLSTGYSMVMTCILTSPTTMTGFYTVEGTHIPILDEGVFDLTLQAPVIF